MLVTAVERSYLFATFKASSITSMLITTVFARTARVMTMTTLSCPHAHRLDVSAAEPDGENDSAEDEIRSIDSYPAYFDESYSTPLNERRSDENNHTDDESHPVNAKANTTDEPDLVGENFKAPEQLCLFFLVISTTL